MMLGQIVFGSKITLRPVAKVESTVRELGLGVWKTLGLEVLLEPIELPTPCFDIDEMRKRNDSAAKRRTKCS
jgi:hypothetical protein